VTHSATPEQLHVVRGGVEHGDRRGRTLGFPTANVPIAQDELFDGVWAGWVSCGAGLFVAAISIGNRPTFYGRTGFRLLEAHLLDFEGDLYGEVIDVWLARRLRSQQRFADVGELTAQLAADVAATRAWAAEVTLELPRLEDRLVATPLGVPVPVPLSA
jgi:FAD synthase